MGTLIAVVALRFSSIAMVLLPRNSKYVESIGASTLELIYVIPVILILAWRRAEWHTLGFRNSTAAR